MLSSRRRLVRRGAVLISALAAIPGVNGQQGTDDYHEWTTHQGTVDRIRGERAIVLLKEEGEVVDRVDVDACRLGPDTTEGTDVELVLYRGEVRCIERLETEDADQDQDEDGGVRIKF